jgi:hypothetical protein
MRYPFLPSSLKLNSLVHKRFQAGVDVGPFLGIVNDIQPGDVIQVGAQAGGHPGGDDTGHAGEGHNVENATQPVPGKVDGLVVELGLAHWLQVKCEPPEHRRRFDSQTKLPATYLLGTLSDFKVIL